MENTLVTNINEMDTSSYYQYTLANDESITGITFYFTLYNG